MPSAASRTVELKATIQIGSGAARPCVIDGGAEQVAERPPPYGRTGVTWIPPGKEVRIGSFTLPGGMLYVGAPVDGYPDPCFIDPMLPVYSPSSDRTGVSLPYWPSYSSIGPGSRSSYLTWLARGRRDASFDVGYAFLFYYGIERRLLRERDECSPGEVEAILREVERLLELYADNRSFQGYAGSLVFAMRASAASPRLYETPPPESVSEDALRIALGQAAADGKPLPAAWALAWGLADGDSRFSYPVMRCHEEFARLFEIRYAKEMGDGHVIRPGAGRLSLAYRPASSSFQGPPVSFPTGLPDVLTRVKVPRPITAIIESCARDLEAYARSRRRKAASSDLARIALLPSELIPAHTDERLGRLRAWLEEHVPVDAPVLVLASDLFVRWVDAPCARLRRKDVTELARVLGTLGFGIDPDPRFDGGAILATDRVALFRAAATAVAASSDAYPAAALMVRLCAAVACADDQSTRGERERVEEIASSMHGLDAAERARLRAYAVRLFETRATLGSLAKRVAAFPPEARERLGSLLVGVAAVDGKLSRQEIVLLTKVFTALGLDPAAVYREAHARATDTVPADEPVIVLRSETPRTTGDYVIRPPKKAGAERPGLRIDDQVLARKQAETAEVLSMLAPIFAAEETVTLPSTPVAQAKSDVVGLDAKHALFLRRLAERASWSRVDVESLSDDLGLLPDGALEVVNDAAYEHAGGPVAEGDDPLEVDMEAIRSWTK